MKILHISFDDNSPGANRAAYRLHKSLLNEGVESLFLVSNKKTNDSTVVEKIKPISKLLGKILQRAVRIFSQLKKHSIFSSNFISAIDYDEAMINNYDIVHIHWIGSNTISTSFINKISKPIVWRLPDMFAITGGCHYSEGCEKFKTACSKCHLFRLNIIDFAKICFKNKLACYSNKNLHAVSPSNWLFNLTNEAKLLRNNFKYHIATGVDTNIFKPIQKQLASSKLKSNLDMSKKTILFGAVNSTSDPRKGFSYLFDALKLIDASQYNLLIFGEKNNQELMNSFSNIVILGNISEENLMSNIYNLCDVMIVASIEDNLPNTAIEAMACGKPVVCFKIGGLPDLVDHKINGYLATPLDSNDLANGIDWVLNSANHNDLCKNAREKIVNEFDSSIIAKKYIRLYEEIIHGSVAR